MSTITTINSTDAISDSRSVINTNFANLNADKIENLGDLSITATATELNYCDGVTSAIQTQLDGKTAAIVGEIKIYAGGSLPTGFLWCDGSEISRTTYSDLFTAIGTAYGSGNGTTTFNVPDLRGRVPGGKDDMGGSAANVVTASEADTLGGEYGAETHTLTTSEIPAHTHSWSPVVGTGGNNGLAIDASANVADPTYGGTTGSAGSDGAHNNMQPTTFINFIIKT